jgi:nitrate/nitrite transport system substrate-binding protein
LRAAAVVGIHLAPSTGPRPWADRGPGGEEAGRIFIGMRRSAPYTLRSLSRRQFLKASGMAALFATLPVGWAGRVFASDAPEMPQLRIGIIALTDCSSIVIAYEKGFFQEQGLDVTISKEASWAVIRDKLQLGENQATHMLYGMPYASTMGLFGAPVKPMIIPWAINYNGQAITLNNDLKDKGVRTPRDLRKVIDEEKALGKPPRTFAMTFPPGTHAMWMRYWLGAGGIDPDKDLSLITIPPPQMVANTKVGKMDGFCVGEPWNARHYRWHRFHRHHHAGLVAESPREGMRVHR